MNIPATVPSTQPANCSLQTCNSSDQLADLSPKQLKRLGDADGYFATPCAFFLQNAHYIHGYCEGFLRRVASISQGAHPSPALTFAAPPH